MYKILKNTIEMDDYNLQKFEKTDRLPKEYQRVAYIESTGTFIKGGDVSSVSTTRKAIDNLQEPNDSKEFVEDSNEELKDDIKNEVKEEKKLEEKNLNKNDNFLSEEE